MKMKDLVTGFKVPESKLTVIDLELLDNNSKKYFLCRCDCGDLVTVRGDHITGGHTKSCGCDVKTRHGLSATPEGKALTNAIHRCYSSKNRHYKDYGARGITVSERYKCPNGIRNLIQDIGVKPGPEFSLDRIDNDGNYCPGNLQWSTTKQQANHKTSSRLITYKGETLILAEWAKKQGMEYETLNSRLNRGWSEERALTTPVRQTTKGDKV